MLQLKYIYIAFNSHQNGSWYHLKAFKFYVAALSGLEKNKIVISMLSLSSYVSTAVVFLQSWVGRTKV